MVLSLAFEARVGHSGVDKRDQDVARARGRGKTLVEVGQAARVDQHVALLKVSD